MPFVLGATRFYGRLIVGLAATALVATPSLMGLGLGMVTGGDATSALAGSPPPGAQPQTPPATGAPAERSDPFRFERETQLDGQTVAIKPAIARGLTYLAASQAGAPARPGDPWRNVPDRGSLGRSNYGPHVGITALACLAFMSEGNLPGRGLYGRHVREGLAYILANTRRDGLISSDTGQHGPMYGHGFATMFLAELYGMTAPADRDFTEPLHAAVRLIIASQGPDGGWRYQPRPSEGDTSVTICQVMALRAARNAGIGVPPAVIDKAIGFVRAAQTPDGGFRYTLAGSGSGFARSAAAVVTLLTAGDERVARDDPALRAGLEYLQRHAPGRGQDLGHYFYGHYYAAQAMFLMGDRYWANWFPAACGDLLARQAADGSWPSEAGPDYGTAMALIVLQLPNRYLPIFQK